MFMDISDGSLHSFKNLIQILVTTKRCGSNLDFLRNSDSSSTNLTFCSSFFLENLSEIKEQALTSDYLTVARLINTEPPYC